MLALRVEHGCPWHDVEKVAKIKGLQFFGMWIGQAGGFQTISECLRVRVRVRHATFFAYFAGLFLQIHLLVHAVIHILVNSV